MLNYQLSDTARTVKLGKYRHHKGHIVIVYGVANHSETLEEVVVYRHETDNANHYWVRPLTMFLEQVTINGKPVPRFAYIGDNQSR